MNTANKITMIRVVLVPIFMVLFMIDNVMCHYAALGVFVLASITDAIDGHVARKYNQVTTFGKFVDPLADKVLICSVLIMLVNLGWAPAWVVLIIVCRELIITGLRAIAIDEGIVMAADRYGKLKTVLQICAIIPLILNYPFFGINLHLIGLIFLYLSMFMALYSCYNYCRKFIFAFREIHAGETDGGGNGTGLN